MYRILATNSLLLKMKLSKTDKCTFCKSQTETLIHLFWECPLTKTFWNEVFQFMNDIGLPCVSEFNATDILCGKEGENKVVNMISLNAKRYIYRTKMCSNIPYLNVFKKMIYFQYKVEQRIAFNTDKTEMFLNQWHVLRNAVENM